MGVAGQDKASWQIDDFPLEIVIPLLEHVATWIHNNDDDHQQQRLAMLTSLYPGTLTLRCMLVPVDAGDWLISCSKI
jgi:hypothetical protein